MSKNPILNKYVSDMDLFLKKYNKEHPNLSLSQRKEQQKYQRIYKLRDLDVEPAKSTPTDFLDTKGN